MTAKALFQAHPSLEGLPIGSFRYASQAFVFEVLTEDPTSPLPDDMGLSDIIHMTIHGHASGNVTDMGSDEVTHEEMKVLLEEQSSDPEYLTPYDWEEE